MIVNQGGQRQRLYLFVFFLFISSSFFSAAYIERSGFSIKNMTKKLEKDDAVFIFCLTFISTCRKVRQRKKYFAIKKQMTSWLQESLRVISESVKNERESILILIKPIGTDVFNRIPQIAGM